MAASKSSRSSTTTKTYVVNTAAGETVEIEATSVTEDEGGYLVRFFNGDDQVASFRSFSGYYPKPAASA